MENTNTDKQQHSINNTEDQEQETKVPMTKTVLPMMTSQSKKYQQMTHT